jgi:hypothetical protein
VKQFYSTGVWRGDLTRRDIGGASKRYFAPPLVLLGIAFGLVALAFGQLLGIIPAAAYLSGIAVVAVLARGLSLKSRAALVIALATMHLSWGWGFIGGFVRSRSLPHFDGIIRSARDVIQRVHISFSVTESRSKWGLSCQCPGVR